MPSSIRKWVEDVPWMQQGVLFSAIRSCDGRSNEEDCSKIVVRGYRNVVLKPAHDVGSFLGKIPTQEKLKEAMRRFAHEYGNYPSHFVTHLMHAAEIIGYQHPDEKIKGTWGNFYFEMCESMHVNPETKGHMMDRLKDNPRVVAMSLEENL